MVGRGVKKELLSFVGVVKLGLADENASGVEFSVAEKAIALLLLESVEFSILVDEVVNIRVVGSGNAKEKLLFKGGVVLGSADENTPCVKLRVGESAIELLLFESAEFSTVVDKVDKIGSGDAMELLLSGGAVGPGSADSDVRAIGTTIAITMINIDANIISSIL